MDKMGMAEGFFKVAAAEKPRFFRDGKPDASIAAVNGRLKKYIREVT